MKRDAIWLIGGGGHAKVVIATLDAAGAAIAGVFDINPNKAGTLILGRRIDRMPDLSWWTTEERRALLAVGGNAQRSALAPSIPARWTTAIHPAAVVHSTAEIGPGTLVCAGA